MDISFLLDTVDMAADINTLSLQKISYLGMQRKVNSAFVVPRKTR